MISHGRYPHLVMHRNDNRRGPELEDFLNSLGIKRFFYVVVVMLCKTIEYGASSFSAFSERRVCLRKKYSIHVYCQCLELTQVGSLPVVCKFQMTLVFIEPVT